MNEMSSKKMWAPKEKLERIESGSKRSLSVLKERDRETLRDGSNTNLNITPSAATSLQARRHSSLGFNEAVEKGDFFKKEGEGDLDKGKAT